MRLHKYIEGNNMYNAIDFLNQISAILNQADCEYKALSKQLSLLDLETQDVLHFIENETFNAAQGFNFAKQLKEIRIKRRAVKQDFELLQIFLSNIDTQNFTRVSKKLQNKIQQNSSLTYSPKVIKSPFPANSKNQI